MKKTKKELETESIILQKENQILRKAVVDLQWMAKRYANKRMTCVAHTMNDHTYKLLAMGIILDTSSDGTFFAHDGQENIAKHAFCIPKHYLDLEREVLDEHNKKN